MPLTNATVQFISRLALQVIYLVEGTYGEGFAEFSLYTRYVSFKYPSLQVLATANQSSQILGINLKLVEPGSPAIP